MRPLVPLGFAAVLAVASPVLAQDYNRYPPSSYDRSGAQGYPPSSYDSRSPSSSYDRSQPAYDSRTAPQGYDRGSPQGYDQGQGQEQDLARELNLTGAQRSAYQAYQSAFAPDEARARREDDEQRLMATMTTPQRLDAARAAMERDRADFDRTDSATRRFYAQLSMAQQRTFDRLTAPQPDQDEGYDSGPNPTQPSARPPR